MFTEDFYGIEMRKSKELRLSLSFTVRKKIYIYRCNLMKTSTARDWHCCTVSQQKGEISPQQEKSESNNTHSF